MTKKSLAHAFTDMTDRELYHYGTQGMHWGERNYQYEDGSLTPAGIARYRANSAFSKAKSSGGIKKSTGYDKNDPDWKNENKAKRVGNSDFHVLERADGSKALFEEDMKWDIPKGMDNKTLEKRISGVDSYLSDLRSQGYAWNNDQWQTMVVAALNGEDYTKAVSPDELKKMEDLKKKMNENDIDKMADEVIRGKYGNGDDRKKQLGDKYDEVQKRVNQKLAKK